MALKRKIGLQMLCGVLAVLVVAQTIQFVQTRRSNGQLAATAVQLLEQRELQDVKNVHSALDFGLAECLARGNMEIFSQLITLRKDLPGFEEFSLYNQKGAASYSSDKAALRKPLAPDLKAQLFAKPERLVRVSTNAIEIFKPEVATAKCLECHEDFRAGAVCGVSYFRFSNDIGARLKGEFQAINVGANRQWQAWSVGILLLGSLMAVGLTVAITRPIVKTLTGIAEQLDTCGADVHAAADEVAGASQTLAQQASEQAAALDQTSAALAQMAGSTQKNAGAAVQASELARLTRTAADEGVTDMHTMATAMQELKTANDQIAQIIKTIDGIAFQTNLLALNAAVEAARAGEAGMGFAVVADQVRKLAESSSQAARETAVKIEGTLARASQGLKMSTKVATDLESIVQKVRQVDALSAQVAAASAEQNQDIDQLNGALAKMDAVTRSNTSNAEQNAQAAEKLNQHIRPLEAACRALQHLVRGRSTPLPAPAAKPATPPAAQPRALTLVEPTVTVRRGALRTNPPSRRPLTPSRRG